MTDTTHTIDGAAREYLRHIVSRIERLTDQKDELSAGIREMFAEAKALGFDTTALRAAIRVRKMDKDKREEQEMLLDTYLRALDFESTPLGGAVLDAAKQSAENLVHILKKNGALMIITTPESQVVLNAGAA